MMMEGTNRDATVGCKTLTADVSTTRRIGPRIQEYDFASGMDEILGDFNPSDDGEAAPEPT
jgi:hypothetical protein